MMYVCKLVIGHDTEGLCCGWVLYSSGDGVLLMIIGMQADVMV